MSAVPVPASILLIDDDESYREGICNLLHGLRQELPLVILEAGSAQEATELIRSAQPDCILLDYRMPGMNGLAWLGTAMELCPESAIIMVTGDGSEEVAVEAMRRGAIDYLVKGSITRERLFSAVKNAIAAVRAQRQLIAQEAVLIDADRQRVMIASLGAAMHHLGQPATVMTAAMAMLKRLEVDPAKLDLINQCTQATVTMMEVFERLRNVGTFRTMPYLTTSPGHTDEQILDLATRDRLSDKEGQALHSE